MPRYFRLTRVHHTMKRVGMITRVLSQKKSWRALLVLAVLGIGFSYLITVISISTHGYAIRDLEHKIEELKLENKKLNLEVAEMQSPARIEQWVQGSGMVSAADVQYVTSSTGIVAAK